MSFREPAIVIIAAVALTTACTNKKVSNPLAKVDSKQPDKVLFDRGMDDMKHNHFDTARLDMQTLINTYPESEYIARAKLALADSWYAEGGTAALAQADQEYRDFITFFPNMPEAAEAQVKIANIQFQQMEKPDRDFTHAVRAEQEYRSVILQYPDNQKMVEEARKKLLQVQEVIAEREFRVGRFYYLRPSYPAAIARLQSLVDRYPLYSKADEALYLLGQSYEGEAGLLRHADVAERAQLEKSHKFTKEQIEERVKKDQASREGLISQLDRQAAAAYSKILTRYPAMNRADDAQARLTALHEPIPRPTKAMLAQNKAEEASRHQETALGSVTEIVNRHPDVSAAATVGDPSLQDQELKSPSEVLKDSIRLASGSGGKSNSGGDSVSVETVKGGIPAENQPAPRSDQPAADSATGNAGSGDTASNNASASDANGQASAEKPDPNELKPMANGSDAQAASDPNELKPNMPQDAPPVQAPAQVNEVTGGSQPQAAPNTAVTSADGQQLASDADMSSSKHKKKKGLHKIIPQM